MPGGLIFMGVGITIWFSVVVFALDRDLRQSHGKRDDEGFLVWGAWIPPRRISVGTLVVGVAMLATGVVWAVVAGID